MEKLLVVCGPTATGKTSFALKLAQKFNAELISADSRQVYQGLDIGTGKDLPQNTKFYPQKGSDPQINFGFYKVNQIPVWGLDLVKPNQLFSVAHYFRFAQRAIKDISRRKKLPLLVGGTGFYIKALTDGIQTLGISPNWELRYQLKDISAEKLFDRLSRLNSLKAASLNSSDRQNPRRLIRALEIASQSSRPPSQAPRKIKFNKVLFLGLKAPNQILYQKIDQRVQKRVRQGIEKEIKNLLKKGLDWQNSVLGQTLAYQEWEPFFQKKATRAQVIKRWQFNEHGYARRQLTWFKKGNRLHWFDITQKDWQKKAQNLVQVWLENH